MYFFKTTFVLNFILEKSLQILSLEIYRNIYSTKDRCFPLLLWRYSFPHSTEPILHYAVVTVELDLHGVAGAGDGVWLGGSTIFLRKCSIGNLESFVQGSLKGDSNTHLYIIIDTRWMVFNIERIEGKSYLKAFRNWEIPFLLLSNTMLNMRQYNCTWVLVFG